MVANYETEIHIAITARQGDFVHAISIAVRMRTRAKNKKNVQPSTREYLQEEEEREKINKNDRNLKESRSERKREAGQHDENENKAQAHHQTIASQQLSITTQQQHDAILPTPGVATTSNHTDCSIVFRMARMYIGLGPLPHDLSLFSTSALCHLAMKRSAALTTPGITCQPV